MAAMATRLSVRLAPLAMELRQLEKDLPRDSIVLSLPERRQAATRTVSPTVPLGIPRRLGYNSICRCCEEHAQPSSSGMHKPARLVRFYSGAAHEPAALLATLTESALGSLCAPGGAPQVRPCPCGRFVYAVKS
jgi:hypothetical protein